MRREERGERGEERGKRKEETDVPGGPAGVVGYTCEGRGQLD